MSDAQGQQRPGTQVREAPDVGGGGAPRPPRVPHGGGVPAHEWACDQSGQPLQPTWGAVGDHPGRWRLGCVRRNHYDREPPPRLMRRSTATERFNLSGQTKVAHATSAE